MLNDKNNIFGVRNPVVHDEHGTAGLDFTVLSAMYDQDARAALEAEQDIARITGAPPLRTGPGRPTPRDEVHPPTMPDMGDIHTQTTEPGNRYYERWEQGRTRPQERPVAKKKAPIPLSKEMEKYRPMVEGMIAPTVQRIFEEHEDRFKEKLRCGTFFNQPNTHLAPPPSAICIDVMTRSTGVILPVHAAPPVPIPVIDFTVPDRFVVVVDRFGHELDINTAFQSVRWSMQRNKTPIRCYADFDSQIGRFVDPTKFGAAILLRSNERFQVYAANEDAVNEHRAFARVVGWAFPAKTTSGDGSYNELHTM